jgi:hypothetical protein
MTRPSFQQIAYTCTRMTKSLNVSVFGAGRGKEVVAVLARHNSKAPARIPCRKCRLSTFPRFRGIEATPIAR